jgi:hypothetical protein
MTIATAARDQSCPVQISITPEPVLDGLPLEHLFDAVRAEEEANRGILPPRVLQKLDKLYQVKVIRLLASPNDVSLDCIQLDDHLGRVAHDGQPVLTQDSNAYVERWRYLRELLATALSMRTVERELEDAAPENIRRDAWELVARRALEAPREGVAWKLIAEELKALPSVATSKSSLSLMLKTLCASGWIEADTWGREKFVRPGPRISRSSIYTRFAQSSRSLALKNNDDLDMGEHSDWGRAVHMLRDYVCFSQGRAIEHFHLATLRHKEMRLALQASESDRKLRTRTAVSNFLGYLNEEFEFFARTTFKKLAAHFERRSNSLSRVRMCLKGNWQGQNAQIVDIIRDRDTDYKSSPIDVSSNEGFEAVSSTGTYFLENDLPDLALKGRYRNPRIDQEQVNKLREKLRGEDRRDARALDELEWRSCWIDREEPGHPTRFYRSTLIIPCTVWNNSLSELFLESIRKRNPKMSPKFDRIILGYLCLDHVDVGFFKKPLDISVGYVAADIISIFLFTRWLLTEDSETYRRAMELMGEDLKDLKLIEPGIKRISEMPQPGDITANINFYSDLWLTRLGRYDRTAVFHSNTGFGTLYGEARLPWENAYANKWL